MDCVRALVGWNQRLVKLVCFGLMVLHHFLFVEDPEKTTDLSQVTDKLHHIMLYTSTWSRFKLTSVVMGTDYIGSCKFNYHTITAMTAPIKLVLATSPLTTIRSNRRDLLPWNQDNVSQWNDVCPQTCFSELVQSGDDFIKQLLLALIKLLICV